MKKIKSSKYILYCENNLDTLSRFRENSVDSIVTDPPYGLSKHKTKDIAVILQSWIDKKIYEHKGSGFMGAKWDSFVPGPETWSECMRVLKPGGHILIFAGSRTQDLMTISLRLAGFEIRDTIMWVYSTGFPKSQNITKAIDKKLGGKPPKVVGRRKHPTLKNTKKLEEKANAAHGSNSWNREWDITESETEEAKEWIGWGTALKPAFEPIILARKPIEGTVADNVLKYGTGGLNIDECRILADDLKSCTSRRGGDQNTYSSVFDGSLNHEFYYDGSKGRFPANFIYDGSEEVRSLFPDSKSGKLSPKNKVKPSTGWSGGSKEDRVKNTFEASSGSAARFFYCAKACSSDRNAGLEKSEDKKLSRSGSAQAEEKRGKKRKKYKGGFNNTKIVKNNHPTVKPLALMRYLVRLVTPKGGIILDPFMGSGSTGKAAMLEEVRFIGIEKEENYFSISRERVKHSNKEAPVSSFKSFRIRGRK